MPYRISWRGRSGPFGTCASVGLGGIAQGNTQDEVFADARRQAEEECRRQGIPGPTEVTICALHNFRADWEPIFGSLAAELRSLDDDLELGA